MFKPEQTKRTLDQFEDIAGFLNNLELGKARGQELWALLPATTWGLGQYQVYTRDLMRRFGVSYKLQVQKLGGGQFIVTPSGEVVARARLRYEYVQSQANGSQLSVGGNPLDPEGLVAYIGRKPLNWDAIYDAVVDLVGPREPASDGCYGDAVLDVQDWSIAQVKKYVPRVLAHYGFVKPLYFHALPGQGKVLCAIKITYKG